VAIALFTQQDTKLCIISCSATNRITELDRLWEVHNEVYVVFKVKPSQFFSQSKPTLVS